MPLETEPAAIPSDALTIAGIAVIAYILASALPEGAGHAGACLVIGEKPIMASTVAAECSVDNRRRATFVRIAPCGCDMISLAPTGGAPDIQGAGSAG